MEKETSILDQACRLFFRYGFRTVTMDRIAQEAGISKKTLYQYFDDKATLVRRVVERKRDESVRHCEQLIRKPDMNAIDVLLEVSAYVKRMFAEVETSIAYELERYYPEAWAVEQKHKQEFIMNFIKANMQRGVEEGFYRENMNADIIAKFYIYRMEMVVDVGYFPADKYSRPAIFREMMTYHIYGIANDAGRRYLDEKLQDEQLIFSTHKTDQ